MDTCDHRELRVAGQGKHNPYAVESHLIEELSSQPGASTFSSSLSQEEFLDVIYWARQAIGIIVGIGWGLIPLKGFLALLL